MLYKSHVFAWWLFTHPGQCVYGDDHKTLFWYDQEKMKFLCQNVSNKVRYGVYEARGLTAYFEQYLEQFK